jgi:hypothetical protein
MCGGFCIQEAMGIVFIRRLSQQLFPELRIVGRWQQSMPLDAPLSLYEPSSFASLKGGSLCQAFQYDGSLKKVPK